MAYTDAVCILAEVALRYNLTVDELRGNSRMKRVRVARRYAIRRLRNETDMSWREIGKSLGLRGAARDRAG